jgi:hypothetical protein
MKLIDVDSKATLEDFRRSWIMAISRNNWSPTNYTRVCSDHFVYGIGPDRKHNDKIPTENMAVFSQSNILHCQKQKHQIHWIKYFIIWVSKFNVCIK